MDKQLSYKKGFRYYYSAFVLLWFTCVEMFDKVSYLFLFWNKTVIMYAFDLLLLSGLVVINQSYKKINKRLIFFISFYIAFTSLWIFLYFNSTLYGIDRLLRNCIVLWMQFLICILLYLEYGKYLFDGFIKKIFYFQIIIELFFYLWWIGYNRKTGILGKTVVSMFILQDWTGRFQGSYGEPSYMGFWLGAVVFELLILSFSQKKNKFINIVLSIIFGIVIFSACKAKFVLISFPAVFFLSLIVIPNKKRTPYFILLVFLLLALFSLNYDRILNAFLEILHKHVDYKSSSTFSTRFCYIFSAIDKMFYYPIGQGIGINFEYFDSGIRKFVPIARRNHLIVDELVRTFHTFKGNGTKETFSQITANFGLVGLTLFISFFMDAYNKKYKVKWISRALIIFLFLQSFIANNIYMVNQFMVVLYAKIILNSNEGSGETEFFYKRPLFKGKWCKYAK